jgi:ketosteroid isomerase-like protein
MSDADLVRGLYEAVNRRDLDAAVSDLSEDFELVTTVETHRGREGVRDWVRLAESVLDDFHIALEEVLEVGPGSVLVLVHDTARGRGSGVAVEHRFGHLWTIRDGRAQRLRAYADRADARHAAGLD